MKKYSFTTPNYEGLSISNLMSSISKNFGAKHSYKEHDLIKSNELKKYDNVVLVIVDGLGYNYLSQKKDSFLYKNLKGKFISNFLSTTACANTNYFVGYPASQHGIVGWDVFFKEIGAIVSFLPFTPKFGGPCLSTLGFKTEDVFDIKPLHKNFKADSFIFIDKKISNSDFTNYVAKHCTIVPTNNYIDNLNKLAVQIKSKSNKRRFLHTYISDFDTSAHEFGVKSKKTLEIFNKIDKKIELLAKKIKNTNTKLIVVSDHGFIDTSKKTRLTISNFKGLDECLSMPLSGDARVVFCFIKNDKLKQFEEIVKKELSKYAYVFKSKELIEAGFFGIGDINKKLFDRVGDYTVILKQNFILESFLANKDKKKFLIGHHGGVSDDEMFIPLITLDL
jgi:predicted AlkP superfamily pyrophosphatase or phosphodiesterase